jgi:putative transposase
LMCFDSNYCDLFFHCYMSRKYSFGDQKHLYFVTFTVIDWIDVFIRNEYRNIMINSIKYCQNKKGLQIYAYCFMSSHIHLIIGSNGHMPLEGIVRDMKAFTSRELKLILSDPNRVQESRREWILEMMKKTGERNSNNNDFQFWQQHNQPIEIWSRKFFDQKLEYIHMNPVDAGFVDQPDAWLYSSARNYSGKYAYLDIEYID